ncbi:MAG: gliding motility-associated C-terminal domain-containing protein [Bacteroidota bacterium]
MILFKRLILFILVFTISFIVKGQTDTVFWFAAPAITPNHANAPISIRFSAYAVAADITISMPANASFQPISFSLNANTSITKDLTAFLNTLESKPENTILRTGIKITASNKISAYYEVDGLSNGNYLNPEIFTFKGSAGIGTKFMIPGQNTFDNIPNPPKTILPHNGFVVLATENNTVIDITPSKDAVGHAAGQTFSITLQAGETYTVIATSLIGSQHLVASVVKANKPISVTVYDDSIGVLGGNYDLVGDQIVPEDVTGNEYIIIRGELVLNNVIRDYFYVLATVDGTDVYMDGIRVATLNRGEIFPGTLSNNSTYIKTTNPVYVNQLTGTGGEMASTNLPNIHCTGSNEVSFVRPLSGAFNLALLCKATDIGNFSLDGNAPGTSINASMFSPVPGTNGEWMFAKINEFNISPRVQVGISRVITNTGFFHLGFFNGVGGGSLMGYFSNYTKITLSPKVIGTQCTGNNLILQSNLVSGATYSWTGPNNFSATTSSATINNISSIQTGTYNIAASLIGCGTFIDSIPIKVNPLPNATISNNDSICLGKSKILSITFTGTAPWTFSISDGTKTDTILHVTTVPYNLTVSPIIKTTYSIQHITDTNFCSSNVSAVLNVSSIVNIYPQPTAIFSLLSPLCESKEVLFTDKSTPGAGNITRWNWDFKDGSVSDLTSGTAFKKAFASYGNYPVRLMVETDKGCKSDTTIFNTKINPLPKVGYVLPEVCVTDGAATFTDTSSIADGSQSQFIWNWTIFPGLNNNKQPVFVNATVQNAKVLVTKEDYYNTMLKITSKDGCTDSLIQQFTVNGPTPKASFLVLKKDSLCSNAFTKILNTSTVDFGYVTKLDIYWDAINSPAAKLTDQNPGLGFTYNNWYPNLPIPAIQSYSIKITAYSGNSAACQNSVTQIVSIYPQPKANFSSSAVEICANNSIQFKDLSNGITGAINNWNWNFSNNNLATGPNPLTKFTDSGNIQVSLQVTNSQGCLSDTAIKQILVYPNPVLKMAGSKVVLEGASVSLSPQFIYGAQLNYLWTPSQYLNNDTALAPISTPTNDITYRLLVTGIGGCSISDTLFVKVLKNPVIPNAFSPNGDGINDVWKIDYLDTYQGATVDIFNRYGQKVYSSIGYPNPWNGKYNGKTLPVGTYYYIINPKNGRQTFSGSVTIIL